MLELGIMSVASNWKTLRQKRYNKILDEIKC